jgi:hypothetical protein
MPRKEVMRMKKAASITLYHGTTAYSWADDPDNESVLYVSNSLSDAKLYAYELSEADEEAGIELKPIYLSIQLDQLLIAVDKMCLDLGSDDAGEGSADMTWEESLNAFGSFTIGGDLRELKKLFHCTELPTTGD